MSKERPMVIPAFWAPDPFDRRLITIGLDDQVAELSPGAPGNRFFEPTPLGEKLIAALTELDGISDAYATSKTDLQIVVGLAFIDTFTPQPGRPARPMRRGIRGRVNDVLAEVLGATGATVLQFDTSLDTEDAAAITAQAA